MESAANNKCLNCKKPSPAANALCAACQETMKKSMESAPKNLFPYILPKGAPAPPPGLAAPQPIKPLVLEVRPRCLADKAPNQRCAKPSTLFFCEEHGTQWIQEKLQLEELVQEQKEQLGNMEANNHSLAMKKAEEIKELQKCDECDESKSLLMKVCVDCYKDFFKEQLAHDPSLRTEILEEFEDCEIKKLRKEKEECQAMMEKMKAQHKLDLANYDKLKKEFDFYSDYMDGLEQELLDKASKRKRRIQELEMQLLEERQRNTMLCDTIRTQGVRVLELESEQEKLKKKEKKQQKGKRELQQLQEGVRTIWSQEAKRPKKN